MEERLEKLKQMAREVVASNRAESKNVKERQAEILHLWEKLKVPRITILLKENVILLGSIMD